ncbi:hypothetical protein D3C81_1843180 [compost metagenome]
MANSRATSGSKASATSQVRQLWRRSQRCAYICTCTLCPESRSTFQRNEPAKSRAVTSLSVSPGSTMFSSIGSSSKS